MRKGISSTHLRDGHIIVYKQSKYFVDTDDEDEDHPPSESVEKDTSNDPVAGQDIGCRSQRKIFVDTDDEHEDEKDSTEAALAPGSVANMFSGAAFPDNETHCEDMIIDSRRENNDPFFSFLTIQRSFSPRCR